MWGTCKIVNFSWLLFAISHMIGRNLFTHKKYPLKWSLNTIYFVNCLIVGLCILCVKMKTFLCEVKIVNAIHALDVHRSHSGRGKSGYDRGYKMKVFPFSLTPHSTVEKNTVRTIEALCWNVLFCRKHAPGNREGKQLRFEIYVAEKGTSLFRTKRKRSRKNLTTERRLAVMLLCKLGEKGLRKFTGKMCVHCVSHKTPHGGHLYFGPPTPLEFHPPPPQRFPWISNLVGYPLVVHIS